MLQKKGVNVTLVERENNIETHFIAPAFAIKLSDEREDTFFVHVTSSGVINNWAALRHKRGITIVKVIDRSINDIVEQITTEMTNRNSSREYKPSVLTKDDIKKLPVPSLASRMASIGLQFLPYRPHGTLDKK